MERRFEMQKPVKQAAFVDVDRTILRSHAFSRYVYESLAQMGVSVDILRSVEQRQAESVNNAFDYICEVYELTGGSPMTAGTLWQLVDNIKRKYCHDGVWQPEFTGDILVPDALKLIDALDRGGIQPVLCTSGGEMTQRIKLMILGDVLGVDLPWIIVGVDQQYKAAMLAESYDSRTGMFDLAGYANRAVASHRVRAGAHLSSVQRVHVIDDKWINVTDIPEGIPVYGYLVEAAELPHDGAARLSLKQVKSQIA